MATNKNITAKELESLFKFMGQCVLEGAKFPSERFGANNVTIQELASERTIESLREFGKFINKKLQDSDPDFSTSETLKFGKVLATDLVANLKLLIKYKEFVTEQTKLKAKIKALQTENKELKTPQERRKDNDAELAKLSKLVALED
jgi:hypothetical protein